MSKHFRISLWTAFSLALIFLVFGSYVIVAQATISGDWKASINGEKNNGKNSGKLQINFERRTEKGGNSSNLGQSYSFDELQGLTREQAQGSSSSSVAVRFSLVREAGTIECAGSFTGGKGAGAFRFNPNQNFVSAMKSRGFDFEKSDRPDGSGTIEDRLFAAATLNVTTALADDLLSANFGNLETEDLFKAAIFKVDSKFMQEMKASGFPNMEMEELVKARIFKIDGEYLRQLNAQGFGGEPFERIVKMRIFKITPEFIAEVRAEGFPKLDIEEMVKMKIFNIDAEFIRRARSEGVPLDVEKLVQKRIGIWTK